MTLTYNLLNLILDLDLDILKYLLAESEVSRSRISKVRGPTDRQTDRCDQTHYQAAHTCGNNSIVATAVLYRYYAILKPMKARYTCTLHHAKKLVIVIWLASFILALPIIKGQVRVCSDVLVMLTV